MSLDTAGSPSRWRGRMLLGSLLAGLVMVLTPIDKAWGQ